MAQKQRVILWGAGLMLAYLTVLPLIFMLYNSFFTPQYAGQGGEFTFANYIQAYSDPQTLHIFFNSLKFAIWASCLAFLAGGFLAWVAERTNTPCRHLIFAISLVPLIIPNILATMAWTFLLSPKIGLLNILAMRLLHLGTAPFNVYSLGGMIWIEGLQWAPLAFLMLSGSFRAMNPALEEAAVMSGAGLWQTTWGITIKLNLQAILSLLLILFVRGLETFEVPAVIGIPAGIEVFTSKIYKAVHDYPTNFGLAGTYSILLMVLTGLGLRFYHQMIKDSSKFSTVTGKGFRPNVMDLGRWRYLTFGMSILYFIFLIFLPLLMLFWVSLTPYSMELKASNFKFLTIQNYGNVFTYPMVANAFKNSILLSVAAATIIILVSSVTGWLITKMKIKGGWLLDTLGTLPLTFPGTVLGVALASFYLKLPIGLYGTVWILLVAYITRFFPYGLRATTSSLLQIHPELEEVASMSGASWLETFRKVLLPLIFSGVIGSYFYIIMLSFREFSSAILLYGPDSVVLSVKIFEMWQSAFYNQVAALGVLMILLLSILMLGMRKLSGGINLQ